MSDFFASFLEFLESTKVIEQFDKFDTIGLLTNPWFLVPFAGLVLYFLIKQQFANLILVGLGIGVFAFMGSHYVEGLIDARGFIQLNKILPILGMGVVVTGVIVYLLFGRSD
jgi:uncharacterized membrane protein YidH (DUF202 family)